MRVFRDFSIKSKQVLIIMLTTGVALLFACGAFTTYEVMNFRKAAVRNLEALSDVLADHIGLEMDSKDRAEVEQTLRSLKKEPDVSGACIYGSDGQVLAVYDRENDGRVFLPPGYHTNGAVFGNTDLELYRAVERHGKMEGAIYIASDLQSLHARLEQYAAIVFAILVATLMMALFLSAKLQQYISGPILNLVQATHEVAREKNYSLRAAKESDDELGALIDGFNEMLGQIQQRDMELRAAQENLERRVEERTEELRRENAERKRTEEELRGKTALLEAQTNSTPDGILVVNPQGEKIFWNKRFGEVWQIPQHIFEGRDDSETLRYGVSTTKYPEKFLARVNYLYAHPNEVGVDEVELKDGRVLDRYSAPVMGKDGKHYGRVWIFRDITERKRAAAELDEANRQLVEISRQAGMAEVATSVLHNVGNVLNSVNISSAMVSEKVRSSKVASLGKAAALLQSQKENLAAFFGQGGKGRLLPEFLSGLSGHLLEEQQEIISEMHHLSSNIEHIKEIVSMQQSYARVSGMVEEHNPAELVEDALRMNAGAMERHQVRVIREFYPTSRVVVDKHKVLQILVNLIRNAKYALDDGKPDEKRMILCVAADGDRSVNISVIDNGVGIPKENLTRIFGHGFTTRKDGHGFGLHSGALAAKELGGSLKVYSDGHGKGATFTLELPVKGPVT